MKIIGHRGAAGLAKENTIASFEKAIASHVDEIELDVRVTKDGIPALIHDPFVLDSSGSKVTIAGTNFNDLRTYCPELTTLDAALANIDRRVPVIIEVKPKEPTQRIIDMVTMFMDQGWQASDLRFASFDQKILVELHRHFPEVIMIVNEGWSGTRARLRAKQVGTRRLSMRSWWLWRGFLAPMHRRGYQISPYTMNDPAKVAKWKPYLYGVITDYPDRYSEQ